MRMFKIIFGVLILIVLGVIEANAINKSICSPGDRMELYPNGLIKACLLKADFRSGELRCKGLSPITFYNNGRVEMCVLPEAATINGQKCKEGSVKFHNNGRLEMCVLPEAATISGQKCKKFGEIIFYPNGRFKSCVRAE